MSYFRFRSQFADALDPRLYTPAYLDDLILTGAAKFMTAGDSAIIVEIKEFPTGAKAVAGLIAAGDLQEIEDVLIPQAERWGKANGCHFGMIESREGWARRMKKHGYEPFQVALIKEL